MASNTENLDLLMKNPSTDGADTFNVQTMLNENWKKIDNNAGTVAQTLANILKPTTPPLIGLPPSTTPDGMFQALGNTGELHVWRKTVKNAADIPAGYTLEAAQSNLHVPTAGQSIDFVFSASITVGDDGTVSQPSSDYKSVYATDTYVSVLQSLLAGKFFTTRSLYAPGIEGVWYCPSNLTVSVSDNDIILSQAQKVNAHGIIPAGTTTTYHVSTNPNAYQEGDDAKEAGYTLGDVVMGSFRAGATNYTISYSYEAASELTVSDDGRTVSMTSPSAGSFGFMGGLEPGDDPAKIRAFMLGKFVRCTAKGNQLNEAPATKYPFNTIPSDIVYIPSSAQITIVNGDVLVDRYQPVTGYAAIPAGTTIEYLGKLGDKARVQVVSYVGTGTYGSSNPNSLTFDFVPKVIVIQISTENSKYGSCIALNGSKQVITYPSTDYASEFSWNKKTVSWYNQNGGDFQLNKSNAKYTAIAIG